MVIKGTIYIDMGINDDPIEDAIEKIVTAIEQAGYDDILTMWVPAEDENEQEKE